MTEDQEKELFNTLATLVTGVRSIQSQVGTLQSEFGTIKSDVQDIKETQNEHSRILNRLDAKTDSIAETVMTNDKRLTAVEKDVSNLRGEIH